MNKEKLKKYKKMLEDKRNEILADIDIDDKMLNYQPHGDLADIADIQISTNILKALSELDRHKIDEINYALKKMESGEYGICEGTKKRIPENRLTYIPWTRYTTEYAKKIEKQNLLAREKSGD